MSPVNIPANEQDEVYAPTHLSVCLCDKHTTGQKSSFREYSPACYAVGAVGGLG